MKYLNKNFFVEGIKASYLAKKFGTPLYCYSLNKLKNNIRNLKNNFKKIDPIICFSVKSNPNTNLLREINKQGLGADVVSIGELMKALKAGIKPKNIVFSGIGKTKVEIEYASKNEILQIENIARKHKTKVNVGIRLNPNTDAKTLSQISTGKKENKFGVSDKVFLTLVKYVKKSKYLNLKCLSVHIGSQILDSKPYEKMLKMLNKIIKKTKFNFEYIDLGGGMGISYNDDKKTLNLNKYSNSIKEFLKKNKSKIILEPGRSIIGNTGVLISKVIYNKEGYKKNFIILDAAMNDLMRPALYNAKHQIKPVIKNNGYANKVYEFVGPICESTDKFGSYKKFQKLKEGDLIIICDVGAYGISLSSNYNLRPKPAEILIKKSKASVISKRQKLIEII
jgi:diaminopimelate decarboxylase